MQNEWSNISEKFKCQWIAPERTGSRKIAEILSYFGFTNDGKPLFSSNQHKYTHEVYFDKEYEDYKLICNARNPYAKTLAIYKNFYKTGILIGSKENFKRFVFEDLRLGRTVKMVQRPILNRKIDYIIKLETIVEDLQKIPFIIEKFSSEKIALIASHGKPLRDWEEYYDQETKDVVYSYTSHLFEMWGYER